MAFASPAESLASVYSAMATQGSRLASKDLFNGSEIKLKGLEQFDMLVRQRADKFGLVIGVIAGERGSGKTRLAKLLHRHTEDVLGQNPSVRPAVLSVDYGFYPRGSPERSYDKPFDGYYRWDHIDKQLRQILDTVSQKKSRIIYDSAYMRSVNGSIGPKSTRPESHTPRPDELIAHGWEIIRDINPNLPVVFIEGALAMDPRILDVIRPIADPITVLLNVEGSVQEERVLYRGNRPVEEERRLNRQDIAAFLQHKARLGLDRIADVIGWSNPGQFDFIANPAVYAPSVALT